MSRQRAALCVLCRPNFFRGFAKLNCMHGEHFQCQELGVMGSIDGLLQRPFLTQLGSEK